MFNIIQNVYKFWIYVLISRIDASVYNYYHIYLKQEKKNKPPHTHTRTRACINKHKISDEMEVYSNVFAYCIFFCQKGYDIGSKTIAVPLF